MHFVFKLLDPTLLVKLDCFLELSHASVAECLVKLNMGKLLAIAFTDACHAHQGGQAVSGSPQGLILCCVIHQDYYYYLLKDRNSLLILSKVMQEPATSSTVTSIVISNGKDTAAVVEHFIQIENFYQP